MMPIQEVWYVAREYAGIAEAGGVKNVSCSLAEGMAAQGYSVTVFIPAYGCVTISGELLYQDVIEAAGESHSIYFKKTSINGVRIVLVDGAVFRDKQAVYVYTAEEARRLPGDPRGRGHFDADIMNVLLQKAVLRFSCLSGEIPSIIHGQDAHTALLPAFMRTDEAYASRFSKTLAPVTIHNAGPGYRQGYPGILRARHITGLPESVLSFGACNGMVEPLLLAGQFGLLTTVSPWYAEEITSEQVNDYTEGLSRELSSRGIEIEGITNGLDFSRYDPSDTSISLLPFSFDPLMGDLSGKYKCRSWFLDFLKTDDLSSVSLEKFGFYEPSDEGVFFSYHGRIAWQKGLDVFEQAAKLVLDHLPQARFFVLGQGDPVLEAALIRMSMRYAGRFVYLRGYERSWARLVVAASDFLVLPSAFEPCGLEDFIGQTYGTIPVAHAVGGLQKIIDGRTGFLYGGSKTVSDANALASLLLEISEPMIGNGSCGCASVPRYKQMIQDAASYIREHYSWDKIIKERYIPWYEKKISSLY